MPPRKERSASTIQRDKDACKNKRKHIVKSISRIHTKTNGDEFNQKTLFELEDWLTTLSENWSDYKAEYSKIFDEVLEEDESEEFEQDFVRTESVYMKTRSKLRARIAELTPQQPAAPQQPVQVEVKQTDALTNIPNSWGHFSGDYAEWPGFRDRYKSRMHDRTDVLITHKWGHLRSSLSGDALRALGKWQDTDDNYEHAWKRLCSQYNDDYMAVQTLIQRLLNVQKMQKASSKALRNILDTVHECISQLGAYVSTKHWDPLIIFLVVDKIDDETRRDWEKHRHSLIKSSNASLDASQQQDDDSASQQSEAIGGNASLPVWSEMEAFLDQQAKILRDVPQRQPSNSRGQPDNANRNQNASTNQRTNDNISPCLLCRVKHPTYSCPVWKGMKMEEREEFRKANKLCVQCVQPNHGPTPCWNKPGWSKKCPACAEFNETVYHNSTLCRRTEAKRLKKAFSAQVQTNTADKNKKA